jgi:hypothetical protein
MRRRVNNDLPIVGRNIKVSFGKRAIDVPAKIDTGADSSAVWASKIHIDGDGTLKFALFGKGSPYYNGKIFKRTDYKVAYVRSASGHEQIRYRTHFTVTIGNRKIRALFNLSNRSQHNFPVLVGRRTLNGKFLVDVTKADIKEPPKRKTSRLNKKLEEDRVGFHKKYYINKSSRKKDIK